MEFICEKKNHISFLFNFEKRGRKEKKMKCLGRDSNARAAKQWGLNPPP